jgi:DHA1 family inner membrane transport protein
MTQSAAGHPAGHTHLPPERERLLLWLLAFTQFTVIMDFMVMMPLGPQIMQAFAIGPAAFATAVSVYSWCAGLSGFFAATYIDRFDRKRLLLVVFALFALSNLGCALAGSFEVVLVSRAFAGLTGGVLTSVVMAIVGDVVPMARRGAAMGTIMTSFSMAAVAGVPIGVALGAQFGWQAPFYLLTVVSIIIWAGALRIVPSLTAHLSRGSVPISRALPELFALMKVPRHINAFIMTGVVMGSAMLIIPFISPMLVANQGVHPAQISIIYMVGGAATLFTARAIGRLSDRLGKHRVFRWVAAASILPMLFITHLPALPFIAIVAVFPFFMVLVSGRSIPLQALQTGVPAQAQRGAFLSVNSAIQSVATGIGAWVGGLLVAIGPGGELTGYGTNGWLAAALTFFGLFWVARVQPQPAPAASQAAEPAPSTDTRGPPK